MEPNLPLPLLKNWIHRPWSVQSPFTLAPGATRTLVDLRKKGFIVIAAVTMNDPNLTCRIEVESEQEAYADEFTAVQLIAAGWVLPMNSGWFASGVFPMIPSYTVTHSPSGPGTPFTKRLNVEVINRTVNPIVVMAAMVLAIEFLDLQ